MRRFVLNVAKSLTYSNFFIALCAAGLSIFISKVLGVAVNMNLIGLIFFATLFAYNFQRKIGINLSQAPHLNQQDQWTKDHSRLVNLIILISFSACFYFYYKLSREIIFIVFPLGIISLLYILNLKKIPSLRSLPFLKVFVVGFVWGGAIVLLPVIEQINFTAIFSWDVQLMTLSVAAFVFGESLPFDIRDWKNDKRSQLTTIPHRLGIKRTLGLVSISFGFSILLLSILFWNGKIELIYFSSFLGSILYAAVILWKLKLNRHPLYFSLLLESSLISPLFFLYLFRLI